MVNYTSSVCIYIYIYTYRGSIDHYTIYSMYSNLSIILNFKGVNYVIIIYDVLAISLWYNNIQSWRSDYYVRIYCEAI